MQLNARARMSLAITAALLPLMSAAHVAAQGMSVLAIPRDLGTDRNGVFFLNEDSAADDFWLADGRQLLPGAALSFGGQSSALYAEIGAVASGAWRFSAGTTLAVTTTEEDTTTTPVTGFDRFLAGGGNLSFTAVRPLYYRQGALNNHYFFIVPRGWANVPALSNADNVTDFGGEMALEYDWHRLATRNDTVPILTLSARVGLVGGTDDFFRTINSSKNDAFLYFSPTATFILEGALKLGVSGFFAPSHVEEQGRIRVSVGIVKKDN